VPDVSSTREGDASPSEAADQLLADAAAALDSLPADMHAQRSRLIAELQLRLQDAHPPLTPARVLNITDRLRNYVKSIPKPPYATELKQQALLERCLFDIQIILAHPAVTPVQQDEITLQIDLAIAIVVRTINQHHPSLQQLSYPEFVEDYLRKRLHETMMNDSQLGYKTPLSKARLEEALDALRTTVNAIKPLSLRPVQPLLDRWNEADAPPDTIANSRSSQGIATYILMPYLPAMQEFEKAFVDTLLPTPVGQAVVKYRMSIDRAESERIAQLENQANEEAEAISKRIREEQVEATKAALGEE